MMERDLRWVRLGNRLTESGQQLEVNVSYQLFGRSPGVAPVVVVTHGLTGNSSAAGPGGWWSRLIGPGKAIDTRQFAVLAFDLPGNGYGGDAKSFFPDHRQVNARDVARWLGCALERLGIERVFAGIGPSLGGGILWEMALVRPGLFGTIIPVAADWKSSDWIIAHNHVQEQLLEQGEGGMRLARQMAMLFYRSPESFRRKFGREQKAEGRFAVETWLEHHGDRLADRFAPEAYRAMNHLLSTIDIGRGRGGFAQAIRNLHARVVQVAVNNDLFFVASENRRTHQFLCQQGRASEYHEIQSVHGHDGFLIETDQLTNILRTVFVPKNRYLAST